MNNTSTLHSPATSQDFDTFVYLCDSEHGWKVCWENKEKTMRVWERCYEHTSAKTIRVQATFDIDPNTMYDVLHDPEFRKVWDENMIDGYSIEQLDQANEIGYYSIRIPGCSNRDFVIKRSWQEKDDREWIIVTHSVQHPRAPEKHGFIRAETPITGYLIRRQGRGSLLTFVTQTDLKGLIPGFLIRKTAHKVVFKIGDAATKYETWKSQHDPENKPWRVERRRSRWNFLAKPK